MEQTTACTERVDPPNGGCLHQIRSIPRIAQRGFPRAQTNMRWLTADERTSYHRFDDRTFSDSQGEARWREDHDWPVKGGEIKA